MTALRPIVLASASPRRRELLGMLRVPFDVCRPDIDETVAPEEIPAEVPQRFSREKAFQVAGLHPRAIIIGADTIVVHRGQILGKPSDAADAVRMLRQLSGERHLVLSGVTVIDAESGKRLTELVETRVWMRHLTVDEIERYVASGDPLDKAAAYAIQNSTFAPVAAVEGCPANVMGLPLCHVVRNLKRLGVPFPETDATRCDIRYGYHCAIADRVMPPGLV
jgi:septum formation protein